VPGAFELPVVAKSLAASGKYSAVVCIGAVVSARCTAHVVPVVAEPERLQIRGATTHYEAVVSAVTGGVLNASVDTGKWCAHNSPQHVPLCLPNCCWLVSVGVPVIFGVLTTDSLEQALDRTGGKVGNKGGEAATTAIETASVLHKLKTAGCL
jgi:6,7-dimethyl-8-ribityllumazine synthase